MGVCLCKDKTEETLPEHQTSQPTNGDSIENIRPYLRNDRIVSLSETVDRLVKETLEVIGTIVDK